MMPRTATPTGSRPRIRDLAMAGAAVLAVVAGASAAYAQKVGVTSAVNPASHAGGKTLALAALMDNKGQVFATDADRARLAPIFERLKRNGVRNVQVREAGAPLDDLKGRMDAVLIDAPCTGTGVWRRRPDAKWRLTDRALAERLGEQTALLSDAARYVKPGGRLVYVTCSLLPDENADQIAAFLADHADFIAVPPAEVAAPVPGLADAALVSGGGLVLSPRRTGTDGFFISVLRRS